MKFISYTLPLLFMLSACSSTPSHIVVAPDFIQTNQYPIAVSALNLTVEDSRTSKHLVQIRKEAQAANLFNSQLPLGGVIEDTLVKALKRKNIQRLEGATPSINILVGKALIDVVQKAFKYQAKTDLSLKATVETAKGTLTKSYDYKGQSEGPLKADIAVLGRDFNQALTQVLNQILSDQELINFINQ